MIELDRELHYLISFYSLFDSILYFFYTLAIVEFYVLKTKDYKECTYPLK